MKNITITANEFVPHGQADVGLPKPGETLTIQCRAYIEEQQDPGRYNIVYAYYN